MKLPRQILWLAVLGTGSLAWGSSVSDQVAKGDALDRSFRPAEALVHYLEAEQSAPQDVDLLVKISRQYVYLMDSESSRDGKLSKAGVALDYAERAVAAGPSDSDAYLSLAICLGKLSQYQGAREKVEASSRIKAAAEKAIALDPNNALAWHMLGRWHQLLAGTSGFTRAMAKLIYGGLPAASFSEAIECFEKSMALDPSRLINPIELGRTYAMMGQEEEARKWLEKGLAMPSQDFHDGETKSRGKETLADL